MTTPSDSLGPSMKLAIGRHKIHKKKKCMHHDAGWFLYFNTERYHFFHECEVMPDKHDVIESGYFGDGEIMINYEEADFMALRVQRTKHLIGEKVGK